MNLRVQLIASTLAVFLLAARISAQESPPAKPTASEKQSTSPRVFGQSYATLLPEQKKLLDEFVRRYNATTGSAANAQEVYDKARMSVRTTFDAITHALLSTKMTDANGKNLGRAFDLIDAIDEVMGEEEGTRGDQQFRMYVYLKPIAFNTLGSSREFYRDKDNTVYHPGFPLCFRLKNGPPSIQFSISLDERMSDIDVDYRSSSFPKALFNGHLSAGNSDVRAGNNLDTHDNRWAGLNGWWRQVFGFSLGSGAKPSTDTTGRAPIIPTTPRMTGNEGVDASAHDFLQSWVVERKPNQAVAYFSRLSYPCLETMAREKQSSILPGMVRFHTSVAMDQFNSKIGNATSVGDVFEAATNWHPELKVEGNSYSAEFRLVEMPLDMARDQECTQAPEDEVREKSKEKFYGMALRGKQGDSRNKVMTLLWTKEDKYWRIIAIRVEDGGEPGITPSRAETAPRVPESEKIAGDPEAVKDITSFYELWVRKRDTANAAQYASERSYQCLAAPSEGEKGMKAADRIQGALKRPLARVPQGVNLSDMMSSVQPVNELVRPVEQVNSDAFAVMAVPDQMADSFLCQRRHLPEKTPELIPADARYGSYYLSASRLNYGEEQSPALLLLWTKEQDQWKVVAWAVEVP